MDAQGNGGLRARLWQFRGRQAHCIRFRLRRQARPAVANTPADHSRTDPNTIAALYQRFASLSCAGIQLSPFILVCAEAGAAEADVL